jgi:hypothetical protein
MSDPIICDRCGDDLRMYRGEILETEHGVYVCECGIDPSMDIQELELPLDKGCKLLIQLTYANTDDEKIICRLTDAAGISIPMTDPWDGDGGLFYAIKVFSAESLAELILHATHRVEALHQATVQKLLKDGLEKLYVEQ